jgi:hypothetical protein
MPPSYDDGVVRSASALVWFAMTMSACAATPAASPAPSSDAVTAAPSGSAPGSPADGLAVAPVATETRTARRWHTYRDALNPEGVPVAISFGSSVDATDGRPRARLRSTGTTIVLAQAARSAPEWTGILPVDGAVAGEQTVEYVVRLRGGSDAVVGTRTFMLSAPVYVVWTLDFEGDAAGDAEMANTAAIADALSVPMTVMWNPRVWTTSQVTPTRADAMLAWTRARLARGDEVALHLHMWSDFVRAAGLAPRTAPSWAGRADGYDVPMTAYDEPETRALVELSLRLMAEHGLPKPTSFRAGGLFANAANLRAIAALGFTADCSATTAGPFGRLQLPWTLAPDAQPYYPAGDDANRAGDLPLLEAPNIAGNTYGHTPTSIAAVAQADLRMIAAPGRPAEQRRALTLVSHPGTIDATERAAIEALFRAFEPYRYDRDAGPLRFVTLAQLAKAYTR